MDSNQDKNSEEINVKKELDGEYVYLGYINNHWGHFIVDFCTRLYYAKKNPDKNFIFLINSKEKKNKFNTTNKKIY